MGGVLPETCWASHKHGMINFDTLLHLVGYFCMNYTMMRGSTNIKFCNIVMKYKFVIKLWLCELVQSVSGLALGWTVTVWFLRGVGEFSFCYCFKYSVLRIFVFWGMVYIHNILKALTEKNPPRCNSVSKFIIISYFKWGSTCFGRHTHTHTHTE
jgi:hypothetical protein